MYDFCSPFVMLNVTLFLIVWGAKLAGPSGHSGGKVSGQVETEVHCCQYLLLYCTTYLWFHNLRELIAAVGRRPSAQNCISSHADRPH